MSSFEQQLEMGKVGEGLLASWLRSKGCSLMPTGEIRKKEFQGPRFLSAGAELVAPDAFAFNAWFNPGGVVWLEMKHKSVCTWSRFARQWQTGIDFGHFEQYRAVAEKSATPVWLLFFHRESTPDERDLQQGSPSRCPVGVFGGDLKQLAWNTDHGSIAWGRTGMVYWNISDLQRLASRAEVLTAADPCGAWTKPPALPAMAF